MERLAHHTDLAVDHTAIGRIVLELDRVVVRIVVVGHIDQIVERQHHTDQPTVDHIDLLVVHTDLVAGRIDLVVGRMRKAVGHTARWMEHHNHRASGPQRRGR